MTYKLKFICNAPYDFTDEKTQNRVVGCNLMCFDETSQKVVKVKKRDGQPVKALGFGSPIDVNVIFGSNNKYKFEV